LFLAFALAVGSFFIANQMPASSARVEEWFSTMPVPPRMPAQPEQAIVATPALQVGLPLAKLVFYDLNVVRVRREQKPNLAYSGQQGNLPLFQKRVYNLLSRAFQIPRCSIGG
jgi:hypothetical protein